jgi:hypothetical protein
VNGGIATAHCQLRPSRPSHGVRHIWRINQEAEAMKKYVIERDIPGVDKMGQADLAGAAKTSNKALAQLAPKAQWVQSYVAKDKTFCVYLAENEDAIREHARLSGFPANKITEITGMIDPTTDRG